MLFCKFLCLFYLMVLSNCYTISKSIATHDHLSHVVDSINDYESSSARNAGKITHDNLKKIRYRTDNVFDPSFETVEDKTKEIINKILSNTSISVNDPDSIILPENRASYSKKHKPHHDNTKTTTNNPVSKHTGRKSHEKEKNKKVATKQSFWHRIKNKLVKHNDKTTLFEPSNQTKIVTRKKRRQNHRNKKYKHKKHNRSTFINRRYDIPVTRLKPSFFEYKTENSISANDATDPALFLLKNSTPTLDSVKENQPHVTRSFKKLKRNTHISSTTSKIPTESQVEKLSDEGLNVTVSETAFNKLKSNAFNFVFEEIPDVPDTATETFSLWPHGTKEVHHKKSLSPLSSKNKNITPRFTDPTIAEYEHEVKSRTVQEALMSNASNVIGCQVKHELKVIKNKMDDLDKGISCSVRCATHDVIEQTAKEMRELACKIEKIGKNMECKPPATKPCNSSDHRKEDVKKKNNIQIIHEYREMKAKPKIGERSFMQSNVKDSATTSDETDSKNKNGAAISTASTSKVKETTISDKLFTSLTKLKVPSTTESSITITTPSSDFTASKNKLSEQHLDRKSTKGWHFTLPFTKEDFSMLRVLEDLLKNQPRTTKLSYPNVLDKPDTKQRRNIHKTKRFSDRKSVTGHKKHVTQSEHNNIPESPTIQTQDANKFLGSQDQSISDNGVESWYRRHFLINHSRHHSERKSHTARTVSLRNNDKKSKSNMREKIHDIRCTNNKENKYHISHKRKRQINKDVKLQTDKTAVDFKKRVTRSKRNNDAQDNNNIMPINNTELDNTTKEVNEKSTVKSGEAIVDIAALRNEQQNAKNIGCVNYKVVPVTWQKIEKKKKGWLSRFFRKNNKQKRQSENKFNPVKKLKKLFTSSKASRYKINNYINLKPSEENDLTTTTQTKNKYGENKFDSVFNKFSQEWKSLKVNNVGKLTTTKLQKSDEINKVIKFTKTLLQEFKIYPAEKATASSAIPVQNKSVTVYPNTERKIDVKPSSSPEQYKSGENSNLYKNKQMPKQLRNNDENLVNTKASDNEKQLKNSDFKWNATNPLNYTWSYAAEYAKSLTNKMPALNWDSKEVFTAKSVQKDKKPDDDYNNDLEKNYNDLKNVDEQLHKKLRNYRLLLDKNHNEHSHNRRNSDYYRNKQKRFLNLFKKRTESSSIDDTTQDIVDEDIGVTVRDIDENYDDISSKFNMDDETHETSVTEAVPYEYTITIYWTEPEVYQTKEVKISKGVKKKKKKKKVKTTLETPVKDETADQNLTEEYPVNTLIETEQANDNTFETEASPIEKPITLSKEPTKEAVNEKGATENELENLIENQEDQNQNSKEIMKTTSVTDPITSVLIKTPIETVEKEKATERELSKLENKDQKHEAKIETSSETKLNPIAKITSLTKAPTERVDNEKFKGVATEQDLENKQQNLETNNEDSHLVIVMPKVKMKENPKKIVLSSQTAKYEIYYDDITETSGNPDQGLTAPKTSNEDHKGRSQHRKRREMTVRTRKKRKPNRHRNRMHRGMTVTNHTRRQRDVSLAPKYEKNKKRRQADMIDANEIFSQTWVNNEGREERSTDETEYTTEEPYQSNELTKMETELRDTEGTKPILVTTELVAKTKELVANEKKKSDITKPSQVTVDTEINLKNNDKPVNKQHSGEIIVFTEAGTEDNGKEQDIRKLLLKLSQTTRKHGVHDKEGVTLAEDEHDLLSQTQRRILAANERLEQSVSLLQNAFKKLDLSRLGTLLPPLNNSDYNITTQRYTDTKPSKITETLANVEEKYTPWKEKLLRMLEHIAYNRSQPNSHNELTDAPKIEQIPVSTDVNRDIDTEHKLTTQLNTDFIASEITGEKTTLANIEEKVTTWKVKLLRLLEHIAYHASQPNSQNTVTDAPNIEQIEVLTDKNKGNDDTEHNFNTQINTDLIKSEILKETTTVVKTEDKITPWKEKLLRLLEHIAYNRSQQNSHNEVTDAPNIEKILATTDRNKDDDVTKYNFTTQMNTDLIASETTEEITTIATTDEKEAQWKEKLLKLLEHIAYNRSQPNSHNEVNNAPNIEKILDSTDKNKVASEITEEKTTLAKIGDKVRPWKEKLLKLVENIAYNRSQPNSHNVGTDEPNIKQVPVSTNSKDDYETKHKFTTQKNTDLMKDEIKVTPWPGKLLQMIKKFSYNLGSYSPREATEVEQIKQIAVQTNQNKDENTKVQNTNELTRGWLNYFTALDKLNRKPTTQSFKSLNETLFDKLTTASVSKNTNEPTVQEKEVQSSISLENENEVTVDMKTQNLIPSAMPTEVSCQTHDSNTGEKENSEIMDQNILVGTIQNTSHKTTESYNRNEPFPKEPNISSQITKEINRMISNNKNTPQQTSTNTLTSDIESTFLNDLPQEENVQGTPITTEYETSEPTPSQANTLKETLSEKAIIPENEQNNAADEYSDTTEDNEKVDVKSGTAASATSNKIEQEKENTPGSNLTTARRNEPHKNVVYDQKNCLVTEEPEILLNTKPKVENQHGHSILNTIIINFGPNMSEAFKTMLSEKSFSSNPEMATILKTTPSVKTLMIASETLTPSEIYTAKEPYLISILPPKLKDLIWIPETSTAPELHRIINKREVSSIYSAKNVDSLEIILDYIDTVGANDSEFRSEKNNSVAKSNSELFQRNERNKDDQLKEKPEEDKTHTEKLQDNRNSIQVHIAIPYGKNGKKMAKRNDFPKIRKIFSAKMFTPTDMEYQLHPYSVDDSQPFTEHSARITRELYSFTPIDAKSDDMITKIKPKDNTRRLSGNNFEGNTLLTNVAKLERGVMKKDTIKTINEDLMRYYNKLAVGQGNNITVHRRNKRSLEYGYGKGDQKLKREIKGKEEETNTTKKDKKCRRRINWNWFKNYFNKNSHTCNCKFVANKPMSKACAASDAIMTELISELEKLGQFMSDHCTEIQTFFWMNPSGGRKLRELVNKINKKLDAYYRRTKGICKGQPCSSFKKKRELNRKRLDDSYDIKRDLITTKCDKNNLDNFLADLRNLAFDLRYAKKYVLCGDSKSLRFAVDNLLKETDKILSKNLTRRHPTADKMGISKYNILNKSGANIHPNNLERVQRTASFKKSKKKQKIKKLVVGPDISLTEFEENDIPRKIIKKYIKISQKKKAKSRKKIRKRENAPIKSSIQEKNSLLSWQADSNNIAADSRKDSQITNLFHTSKNNDQKLMINYLLNILATTPAEILTTNPPEIHIEKSVDLKSDYYKHFKNVDPKCNKAACSCSKNISHCPPNQSKCSENNCHCSLGKCNCSKTTCPCPANNCTCPKHSLLRKTAAKNATLDIGTETDLNNEVRKKLDESKENFVEVGEIKFNKDPHVNVGKNAQIKTKTVGNVEKNPNVKTETYYGKHFESKASSDEVVKANADDKPENNSNTDVNDQGNTQDDQNLELEKAIADFLTHIEKNIQEEDKINQQDITQKPAVPSTSIHQFKNLGQKTHNRLRKGVKHFISKAGDKVKDTIDSIHRAGNKVIHKFEEGIEEAKKLMPSTTSTVPNASYVCDLIATREYIRHKYNILQPRVFKRFVQDIGCRRHKKLPPYFFVRLRDFIIDEPSETRVFRNRRSFGASSKRRSNWMSRKRSLLSVDYDDYERDADDDEKDDDYAASGTHQRYVNYGSYKRDGDYGAHKRDRNYDSDDENDGDSDSYERNGDTYDRERDYNAHEINGDDTSEKDSLYGMYERENDYHGYEGDDSVYTSHKRDNDYGTYERVDYEYSSDRKSRKKVRNDRKNKYSYDLRDGGNFEEPRRRIDLSRIGKNRGVIDSKRIKNEGLFEKLYKGEDNVYREERRRQKRAQTSLEQFTLGLENLPVVATDQDDLYVMKGEDVRINCIPRQSIETNIKFNISEWETSRRGMKFEANYKESARYLTLTNVHSRNVGKYTCKLDGQVVREVRLSLITMPRFHVVFTVLYKSNGDCTYKDLKNMQYLTTVFSEASSCGDKSVQIHEPACVKLSEDVGFLGLEQQSAASYIRATCSLSVCPEPVVQCGVNCVRDIHAKLVKLGAGNVTPLTRIPVTIQRNGVNRTLTPVIHKCKMIVIHKLRQGGPKLREELEFHQLALNMGPGDRDMVVSCRAGYWLIKKFMICAACPANMYSNQGDNKCLPCSPNFHSLPGSSHCVPSARIVRDYQEHFLSKDQPSLWQYFDIATYWQWFRKKCPERLIISNFASNCYILIPAILVCIVISKYRCCKKKETQYREVDLEEVKEEEIGEKGDIREKAMRSKQSQTKSETKENLLEKFLAKPKTQGSHDEFLAKSETQGIQVDPFPVNSETQGVQVDSDDNVEREYKNQVSLKQEMSKKYNNMERRSCICGRKTCTCNSPTRAVRNVCSQEYEKDGSTYKNILAEKSCRCKMPTCVCHKKTINKNSKSEEFRICSYSSTGVDRKNKLSPTAVILARFFRPSTSSSVADAPNLRDSTSSRFGQRKEKNIPPPLPPIDFDSDSPI